MLTSSVPNISRFSSTHRSSYHHSLFFKSSFHQLLLKMLSIRTLARTVPRTFSRSIASSSRSAILRPVANLPKTSFIQPSLKQAIRPSQAAFSTCRVFRQAEGKHSCKTRETERIRSTKFYLPRCALASSYIESRPRNFYTNNTDQGIFLH